MSSTGLDRPIPVVTVLLMVTACENAAGPPNIHPAVLTAATTQIEVTLEAPVTRSLGSLGAYMFQLRSIGSLTPPGAPGRAGSLPLGTRLMAPLVAPVVALAALPDTLRGRTLEYSCASGAYAATTRPGAPAQAVRFILYTTASGGGPITCPSAEIGRADFIDSVLSGRPALHVVAADPAGTPYVNYVAGNLAPASGTTSLTASGRVSDGTTPLPFSLSLNAVISGSDLTGTAIVTLGDVALPIDVHIRDDIALQSGAGPEHLEFSLRANGETAGLTGPNTISATGSSLDFALSVDSRPFARINGSFAAPSFTAPDGTALSADNLNVAQTIFHAPIAIFADLGGILNPAEIVLRVGS
jgi:hypothetical protein